MKAYIKALSYYLPDKVVTNEQLVKEFPEWTVEKIASKEGVNQRHVADGETISDMVVRAAETLFEESPGIQRQAIDFVLLGTQSPDYFLPSTACIVQNRLGLPITCGGFRFQPGTLWV